MKALALALLMGVFSISTAAASDGNEPRFGPWQPAVNIDIWPGADPTVNTAALEGCPSVSPDGLSLYFASNRLGGYGGLDIYVSHRAHQHGAWGPAANLGSTVNTAGDEFCPTPLRDRHTLLFVSTRQDLAVHCGLADIYRSTLEHNARVRARGFEGVWGTPVNLGCKVNSSADEAGPFLVREGNHFALYFSSTRGGNSDIYSALLLGDWEFSTPAAVPGLNTPSSDARPNIRHDGLEMCFDSDRLGGSGSSDLYIATRTSIAEPWGAAINAGTAVNSAASEVRCSISWSGTSMYFASTRSGGQSDLYVTRRAELGD